MEGINMILYLSFLIILGTNGILNAICAKYLKEQLHSKVLLVGMYLFLGVCMAFETNITMRVTNVMLYFVICMAPLVIDYFLIKPGEKTHEN